MNIYWMLSLCTLFADTCHFSGSSLGRLLHGYGRSIFSWSWAAISSIMRLNYHIKDGWFQFTPPPPFPPTSINLHRKWNSDYTKTGSHHALGVICLELFGEIKNLSTYTVSISKQYLSCHNSLSYDVLEQCVEELYIPGIWGLALGLSSDLLILFQSLIALDENTIYMTVVAKHFKLLHLKLNLF